MKMTGSGTNGSMREVNAGHFYYYYYYFLLFIIPYSLFSACSGSACVRDSAAA
jgi:hypothetical protein